MTPRGMLPQSGVRCRDDLSRQKQIASETERVTCQHYTIAILKVVTSEETIISDGVMLKRDARDDRGDAIYCYILSLNV